MKKTLFILTFISSLLVSCAKKEEISHKISLDKLFVTAPAAGGEEELYVMTDGEWKASVTGNEEWVRIVSGKSGVGSGTIVLDFDENDGEFRTVGLVVSLADGSKPRTISLNQESETGPPVVSIVQPEELFPFAAGEYRVAYYSNIPADELQVACEAAWLKNPVLADSYIIFSLDENTDPKKRRMTQLWLTYTDGDIYKAVCTVSQAPKVDDSKFEADSGNDSYEIEEDGFEF